MISVLLSIYKEKIEWIKESVESIFAQTYHDYEIIIIVDNPHVEPNVKNYLDSLSTYKNVSVCYNTTNIGLALSMNKALKHAKGEFVARMDADDISLPNRFENELAYLLKTNADLVSTNAIYIDENDNLVCVGQKINDNQKYELLYTNRLVHPSIIAKTEAFRELGGYRNFRRAQDYDFWLRFLSSGKSIRVLNECLIKYRVSNSQSSNSHRLEQFYISKYQKKLYYERIKTGKDSFSEENLSNYLSKKKITKNKNERCYRAFKLLDEAKKSRLLKKGFCIFKAFIIFPTITVSTFKNHLIRKFDKNIRSYSNG